MDYKQNKLKGYPFSDLDRKFKAVIKTGISITKGEVTNCQWRSNTDGSLHDKPGPSKIGSIIKNEKEVFIAMFQMA